MKAKISMFFIFSFLMLNCSEINKENKETTNNGTNDLQKEIVVLVRNPYLGHINSIKEQVFTLEEKFGEYKKIGEVTTHTYNFNKDINPVEMVQRTRDEYGSNFGSYKTTFKYDEMKNLIEKNYFELTGQFINKTIYKYDEKGNLFEECFYSDDGSLFTKTTYKYKKTNKLIQVNAVSTWPNGNLYKKYNRKYNINGLLIEEKEYNADGALNTTTIFTYDDFDQTGNWVKQSITVDNKPHKIVEREIKYSI